MQIKQYKEKTDFRSGTIDVKISIRLPFAKYLKIYINFPHATKLDVFFEFREVLFSLQLNKF